MSGRPKILILGHGRHGKDTLAEIIRDNSELTFSSSSWAACEIFIFDHIKGEFGYGTIEECYNDRHNHRELWKELISSYNTPNKSRLARGILSNNDMYVGMRCDLEYMDSNHLFDKIVYVDAFPRVDYVDPTMKIKYDPSTMEIVHNHKGLDYLDWQAKVIINELRWRGFDL